MLYSIQLTGNLDVIDRTFNSTCKAYKCAL